MCMSRVEVRVITFDNKIHCEHVVGNYTYDDVITRHQQCGGPRTREDGRIRHAKGDVAEVIVLYTGLTIVNIKRGSAK